MCLDVNTRRPAHAEAWAALHLLPVPHARELVLGLAQCGQQRLCAGLGSVPRGRRLVGLSPPRHDVDAVGLVAVLHLHLQVADRPLVAVVALFGLLRGVGH